MSGGCVRACVRWLVEALDGRPTIPGDGGVQVVKRAGVRRRAL